VTEDEVEAQMDLVTTALLVPLRTTKAIAEDTALALMTIGDELIACVAHHETVSKGLVGKAWFVFTAMLAEADHAAEPDGILDVAWQWQEKLRLAFGPHFDA
jgi:hypothetical protein